MPTPLPDRLLLVAAALTLALPASGLAWHLMVPAADGAGKPPPRSTKLALKDFANQRFFGRRAVVEGVSGFQLHTLGVSPSDQVAAGRDGFLFYAKPADRNVAAMRREPLFETSELDRLRRWFRRCRERAETVGAAYVVVLTPGKSTVHPERLPAWLVPRRAERRADQLSAALRADGIEVFDTTAAVVARAAAVAADTTHPTGTTYRRYDTHWNDEGAFAAATAIIDHLAPHLDSLHPLDRSHMVLRTPTATGGDLARFCGLERVLAEPVPVLDFPGARPRPPEDESQVRDALEHQSDTGQGRVVMFRDSFAVRLVPFLASRFAHSWYFWTNEVVAELVPEGTDVVLHQLSERRLHEVLFLSGVARSMAESD